MLRTYSKNIEVNSNNAIPFNADKLDVGTNIGHNPGSSNIIVRSPGFYEVNLDISFTTTEEVTDPVSIQLYANGVAIPDAIINTTVASTTTYVNSSFNTIIKASPGVPNSNVILTVVPTSTITISSVALGIDQ